MKPVQVDDDVEALIGRQLGTRKKVIAGVEIRDAGMQVVHRALEHFPRYPLGVRRQRTEFVVINRRGGDVRRSRRDGEDARPQAVQVDVLGTRHDQLPFIALGHRDQRVDMMLRGEEGDRHDHGGEHPAAARAPSFRQRADRRHQKAEQHGSHRQYRAVSRIVFRGDQAHRTGKHRQAQQRRQPNDAARSSVAAPLHIRAGQQDRADECGAAEVQRVIAMIVVVQHNHTERVRQCFLHEPGNLLEPVMLEGDAYGFDENPGRVQQAHGAVGQGQSADHESHMDESPARGLGQCAVPLRNQGGRERHYIKHGARLINERAHNHEAERNQPLTRGAAGTQAHAHVQRALNDEECAEGEERGGDVRPSDGPSRDHLRGRNQSQQHGETQAGAERPAERAQAAKTDQRQGAQQQ